MGGGEPRSRGGRGGPAGARDGVWIAIGTTACAASKGSQRSMARVLTLYQGDR